MWVCGVYSAVIEGLNPNQDLLIEERIGLFTSSNGQSVFCSLRTDQSIACYIRIAALADTFLQWCQKCECKKLLRQGSPAPKQPKEKCDIKKKEILSCILE